MVETGVVSTATYSQAAEACQLGQRRPAFIAYH